MARRKKPDDTEYTGRRIDHVSPFGGAAIMGNRGGYQSVERTPEEISAWQRHNETLHQSNPSRRSPSPRRIDYVDGAGHAMVTGERGGWRGVDASPAEIAAWRQEHSAPAPQQRQTRAPGSSRRIDHVDPIFGGAAIMRDRGGYQSVERTPEEIAAWKQEHGGPSQREAAQREARGRRTANPKEASIFDAPAAAPREEARPSTRRGRDPKEANILEPAAPAAPAARRRGAPEIPAEAQGSNIGYSSNRLRVNNPSRAQFAETGWGGPDQSRVVYKGTSYEAIPRLGTGEVGVYRNPNGRWVQVHPGNNGADRHGNVSHGNRGRETEHISAAKAHQLIANGAVVGKDLTVRRDRSPSS